MHYLYFIYTRKFHSGNAPLGWRLRQSTSAKGDHVTAFSRCLSRFSFVPGRLHMKGFTFIKKKNIGERENYFV